MAVLWTFRYDETTGKTNARFELKYPTKKPMKMAIVASAGIAVAFRGCPGVEEVPASEEAIIDLQSLDEWVELDRGKDIFFEVTVDRYFSCLLPDGLFSLSTKHSAHVIVPATAMGWTSGPGEDDYEGPYAETVNMRATFDDAPQSWAVTHSAGSDASVSRGGGARISWNSSYDAEMDSSPDDVYWWASADDGEFEVVQPRSNGTSLEFWSGFSCGGAALTLIVLVLSALGMNAKTSHLSNSEVTDRAEHT